MKWKIIAKQVNPDGNIIDIGVVWGDGSSAPICRIVFPNDKMICANVKCVDAIIKILKARFRESV